MKLNTLANILFAALALAVFAGLVYVLYLAGVSIESLIGE